MYCLSALKLMLSELFNGAAEHHLREGEALFRSGDAGDACYQMKTGLAKVVIASQHGEERTISLLRPQAIVGELSMIDGRSRSASVIAITKCSLSFVSRAKFQAAREAAGTSGVSVANPGRAAARC